MNNIWLAFITGLTTGGISCLAVQGGLLTTALTQQEIDDKSKFGRMAHLGSFVVAKLIAYSLLGFGLGFLGSSLVLTPRLLGWMQIAAGIFMIITAMRLLNIHPIFRHFQIQPPKFIFRILRVESKSKEFFAPALLGFLTIFIPCGVTQAMMALSIATANPFFGAGIMFAFTLGTSPLFLAMGVGAMKLLKLRRFEIVAGIAIAILGIVSVNTGQVLRGSNHTLQNYWIALTSVPGEANNKDKKAQINPAGIQEITINVTDTGYSSDKDTIKAGVPVRLTLNTINVQSCARAFTIPSLNISKILPQTGTEIVEFTPSKTGSLVYTCSMGMYTGKLNVI